MKKILTNGLQTIDEALYAKSIPISEVDAVVMLKENRHLATLPAILPANTEIYLPKEKAQTKETINLWD